MRICSHDKILSSFLFIRCVHYYTVSASAGLSEKKKNQIFREKMSSSTIWMHLNVAHVATTSSSLTYFQNELNVCSYVYEIRLPKHEGLWRYDFLRGGLTEWLSFVGPWNIFDALRHKLCWLRHACISNNESRSNEQMSIWYGYCDSFRCCRHESDFFMLVLKHLFVTLLVHVLRCCTHTQWVCKVLLKPT